MNKVLKNAITNAKKGRWFTLASVLVMSFSFFMLSVFVTVGVISNDVIKYLESRAQITIFFKDSVLEEEILKYKSDLERDALLAEVTYTSKESALQAYIGEHKDDPLLLESLTKDIFPSSLDIRSKDISYLPQVELLFKTNPGVEEIIYYRDALDTFKKFSNAIRYGGLVLVALLLLTSTITVLLTIGSTIYVKNEEISVMRLVGASNWFIRGPFLLQGVLYGLVSAVLSQIFIIVVVSLVGNDVRSLFKGIEIVNIGFLYVGLVFVAQLLFGLLLGLLGSWGALKRYLKI